LTVQTALADHSGARLVLDQAVLRGEQTLFKARVTLACLTAAGTPTRFPTALRAALTRQS
jgi:acyl-CoA thioester hydrolase